MALAVEISVLCLNVSASVQKLNVKVETFTVILNPHT